MTQRGVYRRNIFDLHRHENITDPTPNITAIRNMSRYGLAANVFTPTSGTITVVKMTLAEGDIVTAVNLSIGTTALATGANQWAALYTPDTGGSAAKALYGAQGTDQTTATGAANSVKTLPVSGASVAITIPYAGDWYVAFNITASTVPSLNGQIVAPPIATGETYAAFTANTGQSGTAPVTLGALTGISTTPYVELT